MKSSLIFYCLLRCLEAVSVLYPASINQIKSYDTSEHIFHRRANNQNIKPFNITFDCSGPQCKRASETLDKLTNILSSFIQVKNQIIIGAYFVSFCEEYKECDKNDRYNRASGIPFEFSNLKNNEGLEIYYPMALYKQLADPSELENVSLMGNPDIRLIFNSDIAYWFEGDGDIEPNQPNFFLIAAKELIDGLGLYISIGGYGDNGLIFTPGYTRIFNGEATDSVGYINFHRNIMDSLLITTSDGKSFNSILDSYIDFKSGNVTVPEADLASYLKNTTLIKASKKIEKLATTPDSLAIKLPSGKSLILETSVQPYDPYRSLRFISESKYLHTKDALLTSKVFYEEERLPQGKAEDWPTYPFGPLLIETLELMGYTLKDSYKNSSAYLNSDKDEDKSNNKSGTNDSSTFKANICLLFTLLSLYLFN